MRGVFADAADAGDTTLFGPRALVDLVVSGWGERLRTRPPVRTFLAYRLFERRLPEPYHRWMFDDVGSNWYFCRRFAWSILPTVITYVAMSSLLGLWPVVAPVVLGWLGAVVVVSILSVFFDIGAGHRRRMLARHGYDAERRWSSPPAVGSVAAAPPPPSAYAAAPWCGSLGLALLAAGGAGGLVLWWPSLTPHVQVGVVEISRSVDHTRAVAIAGTVAAAVVGIAGIALLGRLRARFVFDALPQGAAERSLPMTFVPAGVVVAMGAMSMLPITPMVLAAALVVLGGGAPLLLALAVTATRRARRDEGSLWVVFGARRVGADARNPADLR
jgi:hypothetical protein